MVCVCVFFAVTQTFPTFATVSSVQRVCGGSLSSQKNAGPRYHYTAMLAAQQMNKQNLSPTDFVSFHLRRHELCSSAVLRRTPKNMLRNSEVQKFRSSEVQRFRICNLQRVGTSCTARARSSSAVLVAAFEKRSFRNAVHVEELSDSVEIFYVQKVQLQSNPGEQVRFAP